MRNTKIHLPLVLCSFMCLPLLNACSLKSDVGGSTKQPSVPAANGKAETSPVHIQSNMIAGTAGEWRPASYRGLTMGQSTYQDMLRIFGPPEGTYPDKVDEIVSYTYHEITEFTGSVSVIVNRDSGKVIGVNITPKDLSKDRAIAYFGNDFVTTKYDFDNCADEPKSDELYESLNGTFTYLEYRARGIALLVNSEGKIGGINYVSKPIGKINPKCE